MRITQKEVKRIGGLIVLFLGIGLITTPVRDWFVSIVGPNLGTQLVAGLIIIITGAYFMEF